MRFPHAALAATFAATAVLAAGAAAASEHPVERAKVVLKTARSGKQSLTFRGRWLGGPTTASPIGAGATLNVTGRDGTGGAAAIALDGGSWEALPRDRGFKYRDRSGTAGGVTKVLLKNGRNGKPGVLRVVAGKGRFGYDFAADPQAVEVSLQIDRSTWCAVIDAPTTRRGKTKGKSPDAPGLCPNDVIVDVAWLAARLGDPAVQIVDARAAFLDGHIPGAIPLAPTTLSTTVDGIGFQMVGPLQGEAILSSIGIRPDGIVVVYGTPPEFDPTRVAWALRYLGHPAVRYLDGGWAAWMAAGAPVDAGPPLPGVPTPHPIESVRDELRVTGDWVLGQLGDPPYDAVPIQIVDARSPEEYAAGRIPTAEHVQWTRNLADGFLLPRGELQAMYAGLGLDPARTTVVYCLVGWRGSAAWLALTRAGFEDVRVYDGSWLEWGVGGFPVETD